MIEDGLPERELQGLLEILGEAHHADDLEEFRAGLLDTVPRVIPSIWTSYNEIGADGSPLVAIVRPEPGDEWLARWARLAHQNPLIQHSLRTRDPRAYRITDVIDHAAFAERDLYREVFVPLGVHHQLAITLPAPPTLLIGLALTSPDDFTDLQRRVLDLARPHLIQAWRNAAARQRARELMDAVRLGLDDTGEAIVVADDRDNVEFATVAGRETLAVLRRGEGIDVARLPEVLREAGGEDGRPATEVGTDDGPVTVRRLTTRSGLTVIVFDRRKRPASRALLEALGLTPRQAEVLQEMMRGRSTRAIATLLGVTPSTVHKHTEGIYARLGVHDRVAAVSTAWAALDAGRPGSTQVSV
jgi:DNA-binding CsgD family transcriptional regulator